MATSEQWTWRERRVDPAKEHFELRYGSAEDSWSARVPVARVGRPFKRAFGVEFILHRADPASAPMMDAVVGELNYYLVAKGERNPWAYAQYHCGTGANLYSAVHWSFHERTGKKGVSVPSAAAHAAKEHGVALSAFDDKAHPPTEKTLQETLGRTGALWILLKKNLQASYGPLVEEWNFSGKAYGWSFRLKQKKRTIVYMTPCRGHFLASFALGEKACLAARTVGLPADWLRTLDAAPRYAEGRGVRIPVRRNSDVANIEKLASVKVAN